MPQAFSSEEFPPATETKALFRLSLQGETKKESWPHTSYPLGRAEGIQLTVQEVTFPNGTKHIEHTFTDLTEEQFDRLKAAYHPSPTLKYAPRSSYTLSDFFPKPIQILANSAFMGGSFKNDVANSVRKTLQYGKHGHFGPLHQVWTLDKGLAVSGWETAYEVARHLGDPTAQDLELGRIGDIDVLRRLTSGEHSIRIREFPLSASAPGKDHEWERLEKNLKPGDVLLFKGVMSRENTEHTVPHFIHAAIFLDNGLYFHKSGASNSSYFSIVPRKDLLASYLVCGYGDVTFTTQFLEIRRFGPENQSPLPPLSHGVSYAATRHSQEDIDFFNIQRFFFSQNANWSVSETTFIPPEIDVKPMVIYTVAPFLKVPLILQESQKGTWAINDPWEDSQGNFWGNSYKVSP